MIEEVDNNGAIVARYQQELGVDFPLSEFRSGAANYYEQDGLGSITSLTNTTGALVQNYTYDSFGNDLTSSGSLTNPTRYTGRDFDTETNLQFSRARYYDPRVGRFLNEDPSGFDSGQSNFFAYVGNNSTNLVDPSGLLKVCCRDAHQFAAHFWATLNGGPAPCHCFLKLSDGRTLGGYHDYSLSGTMGGLVLRPDDDSDHAKYANEAQCTDIQGKDCDQRAKNAFDKAPRKLGGYGFSRYDYGTSNDAAARILKDAASAGGPHNLGRPIHSRSLRMSGVCADAASPNLCRDTGLIFSAHSWKLTRDLPSPA